MAESKKLCYSTMQSGRPLCYKKNNSSRPLIYKAAAGAETVISFAWGGDGRDLDICAYWEGASGMKVGFGWNTSTAEQVSGVYHIKYSGDVTSADASEWCKVRMKPWGDGSSRTFRVHFNFYGASEEYPASSCTVIASQSGGRTLVKSGQACSSSHGRKADTGDPSCLVTFDASGKLVSIT